MTPNLAVISTGLEEKTLSVKFGLKLSFATFVCINAVFGDPISFAGSYGGSYLLPGAGLTFYQTLPGSSSYTISQAIDAPGYSGTYSASENTSGTLTTASMNLSSSYSGQPGTLFYGNFQSVVANSFSGVTLQVNGPVYLSETVTLTYSGVVDSNVGSPFFDEDLQFVDSSGSDVGSGCSLGLNAALPPPLPGQQSTASCSTGMVLISNPETISVNNSLGATLSAFSPGDSSSFQGTATLGALDVYDANGTKIEAIDLNSFAAAPEPGCGFLLATGLFAYAGCLLCRKDRIHGRIAAVPQGATPNS